MPPVIPIPPQVRRQHEHWLVALTQIPTVPGREQRVAAWIREWVAARPDLSLTEDQAGNLHIASGGADSPAGSFPGAGARAPLYVTAHLDHPGFVLERVLSRSTVQVAFRGGVLDPYFEGARIVLHAADGSSHPARLVGGAEVGCAVFRSFLAELDQPAGNCLRAGDIATWELPPARIEDGLLHAPACDDLAAVAAALAARDVLREASTRGQTSGHEVCLLFTRAEEVGFLGAIAACREAAIPRAARVITLENSRSFEDSPVGGGPIVRVGDRLTVFSPALTAAIALRAQQLAQPASVRDVSAAAQPLPAVPSGSDTSAWRWQRRLMPGGACEASVFCAFGYEATCLCLPLGNYHNMGALADVQAGRPSGQARVAPEFISVADFHGLVDLLVACAVHLPAGDPVGPLIETMWSQRAFVLNEWRG